VQVVVAFPEGGVRGCDGGAEESAAGEARGNIGEGEETMLEDAVEDTELGMG